VKTQPDTFARMGSATSSRGLWQNLERLRLTSSKNPKASAIQRKDVRRVQRLGKQNQRGVGKIHWDVRIFFDQVYSRQQRLRLSQLEYLNTSGMDKFR